MTEKFKHIPIDSDTYLVSSIETKFGELDCVYQIWLYGLIQGSSLIFFKKEIKHLTNEELELQLRTSVLLTNNTSKITFSNDNSEFLFINFNFELLD